MADDQDPSCSPDSGSVNNNGDAQQVAPPTMDVIGGACRAAPAARDQGRAGPPAPPRPPPRAQALQSPLPRNWSRQVDGMSGKTYYVNHATGATSWERPM